MERDNSRLEKDTETSSAGQKFRDIVLMMRDAETSSAGQREMNSTGQRKGFSSAERGDNILFL